MERPIAERSSRDWPPSRAVFLGVAAGLVGIYLALRYVWPAVLTVLIGGVTYYMVAPLVGRLARFYVPRMLSTLLLAGGLVVITGAVLSRLIPPIQGELAALLENLPVYVSAIEGWLIDKRVIGDEADPRVRDAMQSLSERANVMAIEGADWFIRKIFGLFGSITSFLLGIVIGIYLLVGGPRLAGAMPSWIPPERRELWVRFGRASSQVLAGYVRARVLASIFIGVSYYIAFAIIGVNQALLLAVVGGILNLIPVLGPLIAAIPAMIVAAFQGLSIFIAVGVVQIVAQQIESNLLTPLLAGRFVRVPPVVTVLVVALGLSLAGVPGMLVAVPVAGLVRVALQVFYRERWSRTHA